MRVTLEQIHADQQTTLANLYQFYEYDFSELIGFPILGNGRFSVIDLDTLFADASYYPFFIRVDKALAGFVIVTCPSQGCEIEQFFVLRAYRQYGIGAQAALQIFDRFPGAWTIKVMGENVIAQAFWQKTISGYTANQFSARPCLEPSYHNGIIYQFDNR